MGPEIIAVFIPIIGLIGGVIITIYLRRYTNQERMAMIEKGIDPQNFKTEKNTSFPLRMSMLLIGAGIGLLVAYFLDRSFHMEEVAYFSMLFLFGGIGLGAAYMIEERKMDADKNR